MRQGFLRATFGADALLDVITALHGECDTAGAKILRRYASLRGLARMAAAINQKAGTGAGPVAASADPREVNLDQVSAYRCMLPVDRLSASHRVQRLLRILLPVCQHMALCNPKVSTDAALTLHANIVSSQMEM